MNSVIHETVTTKAKPIDLAILDYKQACDSMSVEVIMLDMYDIGVTDNKLNLINACDNEAMVSIKTPVGLTERVKVSNTIAQGDVNSTVKCAISVNDIAEQHKDNLVENVYKYKDSVPIPPLGMVDDIINIALCGVDSALGTAHLNSQTNPWWTRSGVTARTRESSESSPTGRTTITELRQRPIEKLCLDQT